MICPFCTKEIQTRSKAWEGFFCNDCQTHLHTTIVANPDAVVTPDSPTQPGREQLYSVAFSVTYKGKGYQIDYLVENNETSITPFFTVNARGEIATLKAIKLPGLVITPQNAQTRLPIILLFH